MKQDNTEFIISFVVTLCIASVLTLIPIWQLIIIPGIIAGLLNKNIRRAILAGGVGILTSWIIYSVFGLISRNLYTVLDQFGALIIGPGYGWLLLILILLIGFLLGILGGAIGNLMRKLITNYFQTKRE